jgi:hypothetical protein
MLEKARFDVATNEAALASAKAQQDVRRSERASVAARLINPLTATTPTPKMQKSAIRHEGSWWPCWRDWLVRQSSEQIIPPPLGGGRQTGVDAPGTYVFEP